MKFSALLIGCLALHLLLLVRNDAFGQPPDTITANPKAVALRPIWAVYGQQVNARVGSGIGGIPDINGDGIDEFAVCFGGIGEWRVYYGDTGSISKTPSWVFDTTGAVPQYPIVGDFWGTGHNAVGFPTGLNEVVDGITRSHYFLHLFRTDGGSIETEPSAILDPRTMTPPVRLSSIPDIIGADLDGDGDDEMIILNGGMARGDSVVRRNEIWIYKGGPDFQLDTPTVIIASEDRWGAAEKMMIGRWDDDERLDMAIAFRDGSEVDSPHELRFWFGREGAPWSWGKSERSAVIDDVPGWALVALDCDGDSMLDLAVPPSAMHPGRVRLYRSGTGKSVHTRSFDSSDADTTFYRRVFGRPVRMGYLSDSLHRYEMLGIGGADAAGPTSLFGFNGGPEGPDHKFDAVYQGEIFNQTQPLGDVNGDGWNDFIAGYAARGAYEGYAIVLAGGPYIPHDSLTTSVKEISVDGVRDAISVWPNPVYTDLRIAWRGDLSRMPAQFQVHDILGRLVAHGMVESWRGEAVWHCQEAAAGTYLVSICDERGSLITTATVVKQ